MMTQTAAALHFPTYRPPHPTAAAHSTVYSIPEKNLDYIYILGQNPLLRMIYK